MPNLRKDAKLQLPVKQNLQEQYAYADFDVQEQIRKLTAGIESKLGGWTLGQCDTTDLEWRAATRRNGEAFTVVLGTISGDPCGLFGSQCSARVSKIFPYVFGGNPFNPVEYDFPKK